MMNVPQPKEFLLYYGAVILISLLLLLRRRQQKGMRLRLRGSGGAGKVSGGTDGTPEIHGRQATEIYSHIQPDGERPLNVVFNYNGHSWDAYEVLGLPAGSSLEKVEAAYRETMSKVDGPSRPFMEAAYQAILSQWQAYRKASGG